MKAILLAGGRGTRMGIVSRGVNKHCNLIWKYPMIMYPIANMRECGITDVMVVVSEQSAGQFIQILGNGSEFGMNIYYGYQKDALGIADALRQCRNYAGDEPVMVMLGDNFVCPTPVEEVLNWDQTGAHVLLQPTDRPEEFGVAVFGNTYEATNNMVTIGEETVFMDDFKHTYDIIDIVEKPKSYIGNLMVLGLYLYDSSVWEVIDRLEPSPRGEYEITDVNRTYLEMGTLSYSIYNGSWIDCGNPDKLLDASNYVRENNIDILGG